MLILLFHGFRRRLTQAPFQFPPVLLLPAGFFRSLLNCRSFFIGDVIKCWRRLDRSRQIWLCLGFRSLPCNLFQEIHGRVLEIASDM